MLCFGDHGTRLLYCHPLQISTVMSNRDHLSGWLHNCICASHSYSFFSLWCESGGPLHSVLDTTKEIGIYRHRLACSSPYGSDLHNQDIQPCAYLRNLWGYSECYDKALSSKLHQTLLYLFLPYNYNETILWLCLHCLYRATWELPWEHRQSYCIGVCFSYLFSQYNFFYILCIKELKEAVRRIIRSIRAMMKGT